MPCYILPTKIAYSYIRFSTPEQAKGDSERRQIESSRRYCAEHGLTLDESLKDLGVSAFRGKHARVGALSRFLDAVRDGRVEEGSTLIVEALDRLSRDEVLTALKQFIDILNASIAIVTLIDKKTFTKESINANPYDLMYSISQMAEANKSSTIKQERVADAWAQKRKAAGAKPLTSKCPGWIRLVGQRDANGRMDYATAKYELIPDKVKIVRRIVKMATDGLGAVGIAQTLNREKVRTLSKRKTSAQFIWEFSTIQYLLRSKTLIGEYQPCKMVNDKATPDGEPITDYYPPAISAPEFYRMQGVLDKRRQNVHGRKGKCVANLFGRILKSGHDGGTMVLSQKRADNINLVSANATRGIAEARSFSYNDFERFFLYWVRELDLRGEASQPVVADVAELEGRLTDVRTKADAVQRTLATGDNAKLDRLLTLLAELNHQEQALRAEIETARAATHQPSAHQTLDELRATIAVLTARGADVNATRERIRSQIQQVCRQIRVWVYGDVVTRLLIARVELANGGERVFAIRRSRASKTLTLACKVPVTGFNGDIDALGKILVVRMDSQAFATALGVSATPKFIGWQIATPHVGGKIAALDGGCNPATLEPAYQYQELTLEQIAERWQRRDADPSRPIAARRAHLCFTLGVTEREAERRLRTTMKKKKMTVEQGVKFLEFQATKKRTAA